MVATEQRKFTIEQLSEVMGNKEQRLAFTVGEVAEMFGLEKRRLKALLQRKEVPLFWFGNRLMIRADVLQGILDGSVDVGTPPERHRDVDGLFSPGGDDAE